MKIQYCSDLHIEFPMNSDYLMENKIPPTGDILILAGDITYLGNLYYKHAFFDYISSHFKLTYWVPGNHEFYDGFDLSNFDEPVHYKVRHNIFLVNNVSVVHDNVELFFTTLWSKLDIKFSPIVLNGVNDFFKIRNKGEIIGQQEFEHHHRLSVDFLQNAIPNSKADSKIVVTHHVPSQLCNSKEFVGSYINSAFVVEMEEFIRSNHVDYWIYGHHHRNIQNIQINNTRMLTNQLGYVHLGENSGFNPKAYIEV